jgi:hypothetical protein
MKPQESVIVNEKLTFIVTAQSLFEGTMIRQGSRKKSYSGSLQLTLGLTTSHGRNNESPMILIVTLSAPSPRPLPSEERGRVRGEKPAS